jgi:hypothetical protein
MASSLKFVDSIASSPTTRLDLNDRTTWRLHTEGTRFSPPPLDQAVASTLLADGAVIPASAYGLRTIQLMLSVNAASADATATQLQTFYRELNRPGNFLRWQQETTNPVFFRTFRTSADEVQDLGKIDGTRKLLSVAFLAEPFAYGLLETPVSGVTVSTDPAAGSNGCFVDVTGVKGDVESPALIKWPGAVVLASRKPLTAVRRRGTPSATPFPFQAEAMTQGTDTTTQANDANFSGSGNNYSRCTFTTATLVTRLTLSDLGTASVDLRGTYRVFMRYRKNTGTDTINMHLRWGTSANPINNDSVAAVGSSSSFRMADLGLVSIPYGNDPVHDFRSGVELVVDDDTRFLLLAERTAGTGTIDFDFLLFVPADDRLAIVNWRESQGNEDHWWFDADSNSAHPRNTSDQVTIAPSPEIAGGFPMLTPNQTNRIFVLHEAGDLTNYAIATTVSPVSVAYYPRYLTVRPAST